MYAAPLLSCCPACACTAIWSALSRVAMPAMKPANASLGKPGRSLRRDVHIEGGEDRPAAHLHLAVQTHEPRFRRVEKKIHLAAAARLRVGDFTAFGMQMHDGPVIVVKTDQMRESAHHGFQAEEGFARSVAHGDLQGARVSGPG